MREHVVPAQRRAVLRGYQRTLVGVQDGELAGVGHVVAYALELFEGKNALRLFIHRLEVAL